MATRFLMLLALLAPVAATAQPWDGTYRLHDGADCARVGEEGGSLRIADGTLEGVGARCAMTRPVDVIAMDATLYTMECQGGEGSGGAGGDAWSERAMVMEAGEGDAILLVWNGYAFRYDRCPITLPASPDERDRGPAGDGSMRAASAR